MSSQTEPHVPVTLTTIYTMLQTVSDDVAVLKASGTTAQVKDHETRIRSLESLVWKAAGAAAGAGALLGYVSDKIFG